VNILLIEDNEDHKVLIQDVVDSAYSSVAMLEWVNLFSKGLDKIVNSTFDICLCDLKLPDSDIAETVKHLQAVRTTTPIIVLTSLDDSDIALALIHGGVQDYLPKSELSPALLQRVCSYAIERKEQQLELENRNKDQEAFCYSLSHDFKAPIRRIGQLQELLVRGFSDRVELTERDTELIALINRNTASINHLVEGLQLYLRSEIGFSEFETVSLSAIIEEIQYSFEPNRADTPIFNVGPLPEIKGNDGQLFLLFQNLIQNGVKYNEQKPVIDIFEQVNETGRYSTIVIKDNGIGMESKYLERIFKPFQRLHGDDVYQGSGLGLSIAKRIMDNHNGQIEVESEVGVGSTFKLSFPRVGF